MEFSLIERLKQSEQHRPMFPRRRWERWLPIVSAGAFVMAWELAVRIGHIAPIYLPSPEMVALKAVRVIGDGTLANNAATTLIEVLAGLGLGAVFGTVQGYMVAKSVIIERALSPFLVASQAVPIVAIAPLLVIWLGYGLASKVLIGALIVFFPILINTVAGLRGVPTDLRDLMRSLRATRWQMFSRLEVPAALPVLLAGLKVGATLSVIGAVVGEFAGANGGLGYMVSLANGQYDTARMFVGVFMLIAMALTLYGIVNALERMLLAWQKR